MLLFVTSISAGLFAGLFGFVVGFAVLASPSQRQGFSLGPLGLRSRVDSPRRRPHAVLCVKDLKSWQQWASSLGRSARTTLLKQLDSPGAEALAVVTRMPPQQALGWEHFFVLLEHQRRAARNPLVAYLRAVMRFGVAACMTGVIDEYRSADGRLLAWLQVIAKGNAMRLMWWYSRETKGLLYFYALRLSVQRALMMPGLEYVDAGPNSNKHLMEVKEKYGFCTGSDWGPGRSCSYAGEFRHDLVPAETVQQAVLASLGQSDHEAEPPRSGAPAVASVAAATTSRKALRSKKGGGRQTAGNVAAGGADEAPAAVNAGGVAVRRAGQGPAISAVDREAGALDAAATAVIRRREPRV